MGCGCNKNKTTVAATSRAVTPGAAITAAQSSGGVVMHDVFDSTGARVASFSNIVTARAEARRLGGNVVPRTGTTV